MCTNECGCETADARDATNECGCETGVNATREVREIPTGWLCPRCDVVHAPFVEQCGCGFLQFKKKIDVEWVGEDDMGDGDPIYDIPVIEDDEDLVEVSCGDGDVEAVKDQVYRVWDPWAWSPYRGTDAPLRGRVVVTYDDDQYGMDG